MIAHELADVRSINGNSGPRQRCPRTRVALKLETWTEGKHSFRRDLESGCRIDLELPLPLLAHDLASYPTLGSIRAASFGSRQTRPGKTRELYWRWMQAAEAERV